MIDPVDTIRTLVFVEDNDVDKQVYTRIAQTSGRVQHTMTFERAAEAIEYFRSNPNSDVDAVLVDVNLTDMNGVDFIQAVTEELGDNRCPVMILLTSAMSADDRQRANENPCVRACFDKPLCAEHLERILELIQTA